MYTERYTYIYIYIHTYIHTYISFICSSSTKDHREPAGGLGSHPILAPSVKDPKDLRIRKRPPQPHPTKF